MFDLGQLIVFFASCDVYMLNNTIDNGRPEADQGMRAVVPMSMFTNGTPLITLSVQKALHKTFVIYTIICFFEVYSHSNCFVIAFKHLIYTGVRRRQKYQHNPRLPWVALIPYSVW